MSDDAMGRIMQASILMASYLDQLVILAIEYQTKNITADRFALRTCETLKEYQDKIDAVRQ